MIMNPWDKGTLNMTHNGVDSKIEVDEQFTVTTSKDDIILIKP